MANRLPATLFRNDLAGTQPFGTLVAPSFSGLLPSLDLESLYRESSPSSSVPLPQIDFESLYRKSSPSFSVPHPQIDFESLYRESYSNLRSLSAFESLEEVRRHSDLYVTFDHESPQEVRLTSDSGLTIDPESLNSKYNDNFLTNLQNYQEDTIDTYLCTELKRYQILSEETVMKSKTPKYMSKKSIVECKSEETMVGIMKIVEEIKDCEFETVLAELEICGCELEQRHLEKLRDLDTTDCKVDKFDVSFNPTMTSDAYRALGSTVKACQVKKLDLSGCELNAKKLVILRSSIRGHALDELYVSFNPTMKPDAYTALGPAVKACQVKKLDLSECELNAKKLNILRRRIRGHTLQYLNLSDHKRRYSKREYVTEVCKLLPYVRKKLFLEWKVFPDTFRTKLQEALDRTKSKLQIVINDEKKDVLHCTERRTATHLKTAKTTFVGCGYRKISVHLNDLVNKILESSPCWIEKLEFSSCNVKKTHLEKLCWGIKNANVEISKLCLDYNRESVEELIPMCCEIFNKCNTTSLSLAFGKLNVKAMQMLSKCLKGRELGELNICYNQDIDLDGYDVLGKILRKHKVKILRAADCNISDEKIQKLFSPPSEDKESRLEVLDISWSKNLSATSFMRLGELVRDGRILQLKLSGVNLTKVTLQAFHGEVLQNEEVLLEDLDVSYNSTMEPEAYEILGSVVKTCSVKKLSLAGCDTEEAHILNLREKTKEHKMISLDASDNSSIGNNIKELAKFVSEKNLDELDISDCNLFAHELKEFQSALGNKTKLKSLILGDRNNELGEKYISEVCNLFPNITKKMHLKFRILRGKCRDLLQKKRAELNASTLEVILNGKEAL